MALVEQETCTKTVRTRYHAEPPKKISSVVIKPVEEYHSKNCHRKISAIWRVRIFCRESEVGHLYNRSLIVEVTIQRNPGQAMQNHPTKVMCTCRIVQRFCRHLNGSLQNDQHTNKTYSLLTSAEDTAAWSDEQSSQKHNAFGELMWHNVKSTTKEKRYTQTTCSDLSVPISTCRRGPCIQGIG